LFDGPFGSNLKTSDYTDAGVRVVRLENLANPRFVEEKRTFVSAEKYESLRKHTVVEGDILARLNPARELTRDPRPREG
jgi:type I restriction enzyme S subunit